LGKLSASAGVARTGEKRRKWLQHGRGGEVEVSLAARTVHGDVLHEFSGAANCFPMNSGFLSNDRAGLDIWQGREHPFEEVHARGIIVIVEQRRPGRFFP